MADQRIEIEIVMDDGSIKKAFGTIKKEAKQAADETNKIFDGLSNPIRALGLEAAFDLFDRFIGYIKKTAQAIVGLSVEAEKIRVVNAQFAAFTQQNAINTDNFNRAIQRSIQGLLDDEEALQIANNAMIRLGISAQQLPEIFELARKASAAGFNDIAFNAEALVTAIQTGNTKQLKSIGITVDLTKAQTEYAKSVSLTVDQLNEEQKAFVNSNVILEEARKKFGNVDASVNQFSDSLTRLKVAFNDSNERGAVLFDKVFGPAVKALVEVLTESLNGNAAALKANKVNASDLAAEIPKVEAKIADLNAKLLNARTDTQYNVINRQLNETSQLLQQLKLRQTEYESAANRGGTSKQIADQKDLNNAIKLTAEQQQLARNNILQKEQVYQQSMMQYQQQELAARQSMLGTIANQDQLNAERYALYQAQLVQIAEQGNQQRLAIETNFSNQKGYNQEQRDALEIQRVEATNAQILAANQAYQQDSLSDFGKFMQMSERNFKKLGDTAKIMFVSQIGNAFAAFGGALAKGEDAMAAFGNAILGILGDIAIQMGQSYILQGIAMSLNPLTPGSGGGLIAAGAALAVFGGFLKGLSGGGGSAATAGGGGATGAEPNIDQTSGFTAATPLTGPMRTEPQTVVNFTVQGDILDSDSTQSRIVALLNDAIDTKGAVVRGLA